MVVGRGSSQPATRRRTEGHAVGNGYDFGSSHFHFRNEMGAQVIANGNDFVAVHVNQRGGGVQVLAAVYGTHEGHFQAAQSEVAYPAGSAGVAVHHVDSLAPHQLPDAAGVAQALAVVAVRNGYFQLGGRCGQLVGIGQQPHLVALGTVRFGKLHGVGD